jgi:valyl-tRNA synthetase
MFVSEEPPPSCEKCGGGLRQDEDVLDTWFSSALWPFSTLGWPEETRDLQHYYPTDLLITGHDIIFFWVARMMMMGLKFMNDVPFRDVYIHGLVRDAQGQKMSKSKGNTVDPEEVQERYGTDAVRFTMAILAAPGNDIPLAPQRMEGYRAFANKLWNACRFVLMKVGDRPAEGFAAKDLRLTDRWILSRTQSVIRDVEGAMESFRFDHAADLLYHFVWHEFCDWYIEFVKPDIQAAATDDDAQAAARLKVMRAVLLDVLGVLLRLLHPMMPFITEELWHKLPQEESFLAAADWPLLNEALIDTQAEEQVALLQETVVKIRNLRAESNIDAARRIEVLLVPQDSANHELLATQSGLIAALVRAAKVRLVDRLAPSLIAARGAINGVQIALPLEGLLDLDAERARLRKDLGKLERELQGRAKKLSNSCFVERAPEDVVEKERRLHRELLERKDRLEQHLAELGS